MQAIKSSQYNPDTAKKRLFYWLLIFFIGISLPVYFLLHKVYSQLQDETWYRQRNQAELLVQRIERQLLEKLQPEQERPIAEYSFFNVLENQLLQSTSVDFSPLSELPPKSDIPGLIGYFQIDPNGTFHIPALPELKTDLQSGLSSEALATRIALKNKLHGLLILHAPKAEQAISTDKQARKDLREDNDSLAKPVVQADHFNDYFQSSEQDEARVAGSVASKNKAEKKRRSVAPKQKNQRLSEEKLQQLNIETTLWKQKSRQNEAPSSFSYDRSLYKRDYRLQARKEMVQIPDQAVASEIFKRNKVAQVTKDYAMQESESQPEQAMERPAKLQKTINKKLATKQQAPVRILSFESEVSPLQLISLGNQHLCFYRNAWNAKTRYIQGLIVDARFLQTIIQPVVNTAQTLAFSSLLIVDKGSVLQQFKARAALSEVLIFRRSLLAPFQEMEIIVNSSDVSAASGKQILDMVSAALALIIGAGFILFYRLGARQIELAKQQRNFISSVSHELKTPLTSIRMYSEMLRSDWVVDASRKQSYYDYIYFESERLSRLISNVLQLARLDNHHKEIQLVEASAKQLLSKIQAICAAQIEASHFQLKLASSTDELADAELQVDEDAFYQIMINLVDNAIKFSKSSDNKSIDIGYRISNKGKQLIFYVRDYGPGVERQQMKKIFRLFYRAGDEMTRTQPGTGIGLALVVQLAESMGAVVDLVNRKPGAEFQLKFSLQ
ncbi:MAG: hypothetical protein GQ583_12490 [Methyloprofundus sp.]|nr:hypothetical protein [Methyloprofundus sp.]